MNFIQDSTGYTTRVADTDDSIVYHHVDAQSDHTVLTRHPHYRHFVDILVSLGHKDWRAGQLHAITALCEDLDVFCALPPGSGKSLIFQIAGLYKAMLGKGITFVVTPLISLMKDQISYLMTKGIYVMLLYHDQDRDLYKQCIDVLRNSTHLPVFVYITAERIALPDWMNLLDDLYQKGQIGLFVLDEAQVILEWGQGYRPKYMSLRNLKVKFPRIPILALSGSMSPKTLQPYINFVGIQGCHLVTKNPDCSNLYYKVLPMDGKRVDEEVLKFVKKQDPNSSGIIYCRTPKHCENLQRRFKHAGIPSLLYHGGMTDENRTMSYQLWKHNFCHIIIATVAFGMGIDKEDVRFILHRDLPKNLSSYIQETGRAGRDGKPAICVLYFTYSDCHKNYALALDGPCPGREDYLAKEIIPFTQELLKMCISLTTCRRVFILAHYDLPAPLFPCNNCDICCLPKQECRIARVKKQFIHLLTMNLKRLSEAAGGHTGISISALSEAFAQDTPYQLFRNLLYLDEEQFHRVQSKEGRVRACRRVIHNLILQGVITEYPVKRKYYNFYLKVGNTADTFDDFTILL